MKRYIKKHKYLEVDFILVVEAGYENHSIMIDGDGITLEKETRTKNLKDSIDSIIQEAEFIVDQRNNPEKTKAEIILEKLEFIAI